MVRRHLVPKMQDEKIQNMANYFGDLRKKLYHHAINVIALQWYRFKIRRIKEQEEELYETMANKKIGKKNVKTKTKKGDAKKLETKKSITGEKSNALSAKELHY